MNDKEALDMMQRCKGEIQSLHAEIARLRPRAEAYESVAKILDLLPSQSMGMGENLIWVLDKRIREIEESLAKPAVV